MALEHWWQNTMVQCTCKQFSGGISMCLLKVHFLSVLCKNNNTRFLRTNPRKLLWQIHRHAFSRATWSYGVGDMSDHALVCEILFDLSRLVTWRSPSCQDQNIPFWLISDHPNPNLSTPVSFSSEFSDFPSHSRVFQQSSRKAIAHWSSAELLELSYLISDYLRVTFWTTSVSHQLFCHFLLGYILWLFA